MQLHISKVHKPAFLAVDDNERVVELATRYLQGLERQTRYSSQTKPLYAQRLTTFLDFIEEDVSEELTVDDAIKVLDLDDADLFYAALSDQGLRPGTIGGYEVVVRNFSKWLTTQSAGRVHKISFYDGVKARTAKAQRVVPRYVLKETVIKLLKCMHIEEHRVAGHFLYDTGARVSELERGLKADLPNPDEYPVDTGYFPLLLRGAKGPAGSIKERYTVISKPMLARIQRYHNTPEYRSNLRWGPEDKPLFLNSDGGPLTKKAVQKAIADARKRSDIVEKVSGHRLRHGMAVSVLSSDMGRSMLDNLIMLKFMLGHNDLETTEKYLTIPVAVIQQIADANRKLGRDRIHDAEDIFTQTFVPRRLHAPNRRGPKRG